MYLKGVRPSLSKWTASIKRQGKNVYLGTFDTEQQAHAAYLCARAKTPRLRKEPKRTSGLPPVVSADVVPFPLTQGFWTLVSLEDAEFVSSLILYVNCDKNTNYATTYISGKLVPLHRLLLTASSGYDVDHVNGNGLDNTRENLRLCSRTENLRNKRGYKNTSSKYKGVYLLSSGMWRAKIGLGSKNSKHLGVFTLEEDAARAYDAAALFYFGEFARLNFDKDGFYAP